MPLHNTLTGNELHEPKGADTATNGQVYISDGAGSGAWTTWPFGWGTYSDDAAEQTFNTTAAKLSINSGSVIETYLPLGIRGSGSLWDATNDVITPISVGDTYIVRLSLPITSRTSANYATIQLDIGGSSSPTNVIFTSRIETDRSAPFNHTVPMSIFTLATFLANGGQIFITTDTGSIGITAPSIYIKRTGSGDI